MTNGLVLVIISAVLFGIVGGVVLLDGWGSHTDIFVAMFAFASACGFVGNKVP